MSYGVKNLIDIPTYVINIPKPELIQALNIIINQIGRIRKKEMAEQAEKDKLISIF